MASIGSGLLELSILDLKLDKTIMGKDLSIEIEIDNQSIITVPVNKNSERFDVDITNANEIMELKICAGSANRSKHIDSFFVPIDFFREATPETVSGFEIKRREEGWIYFDRNGYLLKDSRRKRRGIEISFVFTENGSSGTGVSAKSAVAHTTTVTTTTTKKSFGSSMVKRSPPRANALRGSQRLTRSPPSAQSSAARAQNSATAEAVSRSQQRRVVKTLEYRPTPIDAQSQQEIDRELVSFCGELDGESKSHINQLDQNVEGLKEVSRQIEATIDEIEQVRNRDIKRVRNDTIDKLDILLHRSEGLAQLHDAQSRLTEKQNQLLEKEYQLDNLKHGNTLLTTIMNKAAGLNTDRDKVYSKFNEILSKDIEDQRTEVFRILEETEKEGKDVKRSGDIDRTLSEIAHAIKVTAVDEIRKREGLQEKYAREKTKAKEEKMALDKKISKADDELRKLKKHLDGQKNNIAQKEDKLANIRDTIVKERQGLVEDENKNADLEKKLQELKNRMRMLEQENLVNRLRNINNTKANIQEQLLKERDNAMMDWMRDRINEDTGKKKALEEKLNQCYSFETREVIDLFEKEKEIQREQRQDFINALQEELQQKKENEQVIKEEVDSATVELKKLKKGAKPIPEFEDDLNIDHEKLYGDLKEVALDNLDKNQTLATSKKDVKELEVKILLIQDDINNLRSSCEELEILIEEMGVKEYPSLEIDESELLRLREELRIKRTELHQYEDQKADLERRIREAEKEYRNIRTYTSRRFVIKELNDDGEEVKVETQSYSQSYGYSQSHGGGSQNFRQTESYGQNQIHNVFKNKNETYVSSSAHYSPNRIQIDPEEVRRTTLARSPKADFKIDRIMKEKYYGRPGPKISKTEDGTFIYGTREFVVWEEFGTLYARDLDADNSQKEELENYLKIHEIHERHTALKTNLAYLNDDIGSEDEEMAEVGEEFESRDNVRYGLR